MIKNVCVCGAGTMGSGIAQVCAQAKLETILFDVNEKVLHYAAESILKNLDILVSKSRISDIEKNEIFNRFTFTNNFSDCNANIIIEAIIEKIEAKVDLFNQLDTINTTKTIFASNTSSLSISEIQENVKSPERFIGLHFFNPAPQMRLVEIIRGRLTSENIVRASFELCKVLGKSPVICKDVPGFIVNRIARHYYLEAMKIIDLGIASIETVDEVMEASGFKMGPFKLMDLIGMDINLSVSQSLYESFEREIRFRPSHIQEEKVRNGQLGRKTGNGFYKY